MVLTKISIVKQILACGLLLSAIGDVVVAQRAASHSARFDPSGNYHPLNQPPESDRFVQFNLEVRHKRGRLVAWGDVEGERGYRFRSVSVTEKHLRFSTERHHGISYDFEGSFLRGGDFSMVDSTLGFVALKGRLRKFLKGKQIMSLTGSFVYYGEC
jgi:hypothetical protein